MRACAKLCVLGSSCEENAEDRNMSSREDEAQLGHAIVILDLDLDIDDVAAHPAALRLRPAEVEAAASTTRGWSSPTR
jgi:hypothetical protein